MGAAGKGRESAMASVYIKIEYRLAGGAASPRRRPGPGRAGVLMQLNREYRGAGDFAWRRRPGVLR